MIFNFKIETCLGLRYYSGGETQGSGQQKSTSEGSSSGSSLSSSKPQMTPQQLLSLYQTALPQMLSTATKATANGPNAAALNAANQGAVSGVNAINLSGLSPGESNAVQRSTNQTDFGTGNLGNGNATNTIKNAMNFGGAFNSKIPMMNASTNAASTAANAGTGALGVTTGLFNPIASNASAPISMSNSLMSSASSGSGSGSSSNSGFNVGCFLTTACCKWKGLPDDCEELTVLRKFRDEYVPKKMVEEYYEIAPKIVEKIEKQKAILEYIYLTIKDCVTLIKSGEDYKALNRYKLMVQTLKGICYGHTNLANV